jgi:hypothetical protein
MPEAQTDTLMLSTKPTGSEAKGQDLLSEGVENETKTIISSDINDDAKCDDDENSKAKSETHYTENVKGLQLSDETALSFPQRVSTGTTVIIVVCVDVVYSVGERLDRHHSGRYFRIAHAHDDFGVK